MHHHTHVPYLRREKASILNTNKLSASLSIFFSRLRPVAHYIKLFFSLLTKKFTLFDIKLGPLLSMFFSYVMNTQA